MLQGFWSTCTRRGGARRWLAAGVALALLAPAGCASSGGASSGDEVSGAERTQRTEGELEPRYQPREPEPEPWYNSDYLFGMTRGVTDSTMHPAAKLPLLVLTVPLDLVLLPFAAIGGLFG